MKMKTIYKVSGLLFLLFFFSQCSEDTINENGIGLITGTVVKKTENTPIANVKITTVPATTTVFTNQDGEFTIEDVPTGQYSVQAEKDGFLSAFEAANIQDGNTVNVVFELEISSATNKPPNQPVLISPTDNQQDVPLSVALIWSGSDPDDDALTYNLEVRNSTNETIYSFNQLQDTTQVIDNLVLGETYFWQVTADDAINNPVTSVISSFKTITESSNRFYYTKFENGNNVIYSGSDQGEVGVSNFNEFRLTDPIKNSFRPRKNNVANKIAFLRTVGSETHLFTMNTDGSEVTQITSTVSVAGFNLNEVDFCWYQNGQRLYYPHLNKLYSINLFGNGLDLVYEAPQDTFITEVATNQADNTILLKTNDASGYNARIFGIGLNGIEQFVVIENQPGALGGIDFSIDGTKVIYTRDVSGFENQNYRQLDTKIFEYDIQSNTTTEIDTEKPLGTNDLDCKYSPDNGFIIYTNTSNDGASPKNIYRIAANAQGQRQLLFSNASMPDWQ
jgi:hypothetical protein